MARRIAAALLLSLEGAQALRAAPFATATRRATAATSLAASVYTHGHARSIMSALAAPAPAVNRLRGGHARALMSALAAPAPEVKEKFRKDYTPVPYRIDSLSLDFNIHEDETLVTSTLTVMPAAGAGVDVPMDLDGEDLALRSIEIDGTPLTEGTDYALTPDGLSLLHPPHTVSSFVLKTVVAIEPQKNTQLSGLYKSGGMYVTQCEAEGFRRITYFQDRPDVMAKYECRIEADKKSYPLLLSNGNELGSGDIGDGRHWASFEDPFRKPSYLFAAVAADLGGIEDTFVTSSGRRYDLDVYHIIAVNDFNMGAMENKGLNVFNTAAVLAKPSTATDADFERVQSIVGHEYFHNWSGNRVTCRDWFQLTLKEGLTVFRDQHFSQDMTSAAVKRIEEARIIRSAQFAQDAGPMAHPIRPESYIAMDNFYTGTHAHAPHASSPGYLPDAFVVLIGRAFETSRGPVTVYNKGAEVIRMYRTLLGRDAFRKGMDVYFERHDGSAVTCDDFRKAMADSSGKDLSQFERWYLQAGTPTVTATSSYDAATQTFSLTLAQTTPPTPGQPDKLPFVIPVEVGLLAADGSLMHEAMLELTEDSQTFTFPNTPTEPLPSLLRGFSAPVKLNTEITPAQLAFLAANDDDPFNRWDASQRLYSSAILNLAKAWQASGGDEAALTLDSGVSDAFSATLTDQSLDPSLRAYSLTMPDFSTLAQEMEVIDADALIGAIKFVRKSLAGTHEAALLDVYKSLATDKPYAVDEEQVGARRLRNACLGYLAKLQTDETTALCLEQFRSAASMTDSIAALQALSTTPGAARDESLGDFYSRAKANNEVLVINKWLSVQAMADTPTALDDVRSLMAHEAYDGTNPNTIRSVLNTFAAANPAAFHRLDGSGYEFITDQIIDLDGRNPQVAARLAGVFNTWRRHTPERQALMQAQLERLKERVTSKDTLEIVTRSLA